LLGVSAFAFWVMASLPELSGLSRWGAAAIASGPFFLLGAAMVVRQQRTRIVAGTEGLRWRSLGRWRRAGWDEVTDYYYLAGLEGTPNQWEVETLAGTLKFGTDITRGDALRAAIVQRATHARARSWGQKGVRAEDPWPRHYGYRSARADWVAVRVASSAMIACACAVLCWLVPTTLSTAAEIGWPLAVTQALVGLLIIGVMVVMAMALVPAVKETRRRHGESISVDQDGILFHCEGEQVAARWDEVSDYFTTPSRGWIKDGGRSVVVTRNGTIDFTPALHWSAHLREIIRLNATAATAKEWSLETPERLGSDELCWTSECPGVGQRIFHYRTRTNRTGLAVIATPWLGFVLGAATAPLRDVEPGYLVWTLTTCAASTVLLLWAIWIYHSAAILIDEYGITQRAWNGPRFLRWEEIEELRESGSQSTDVATLVAKGKRLRFRLSVADAPELKAEIAARTGKPWRNRDQG